LFIEDLAESGLTVAEPLNGQPTMLMDTGITAFSANKFLNRYCEWGLDLESILLARMHKILLQQHLPLPDIAPNPEILFRPRGAGGYQPEAE